jgi:phosphonate transport system substrate-binding protein
MPQHAKGPGRGLTIYVGLILALLPFFCHAEGNKLSFAVQPILEKDATIRFYQPLVEYLRKETGLDIEFESSINFLTYWQKTRRGDFDLVLDAAHFTAYRMTQLDYQPIAKVPGTVSYSLITTPDLLIFEADELIGKHVACAAPPSLGMVRLQEMFTNPLREPVIKESPSAEKAINMLENGQVVAAMVPTPLLNIYPDFNVVATTEPAPHVTFSVSPGVSTENREKLRKALLGAAKTPEGQLVLERINFPALESPAPGIYKGYEKLLMNTWGF